MGQFLSAEVCRPLAISGLFLGVPPEDAAAQALHAPLAGIRLLRFALGSLLPALVRRVEVGLPQLLRALRTPSEFESVPGGDLFAVWNTVRLRAAELPSANVNANARSMARLMACCAAGGELDGARVLSAAALEAALAEPTTRATEGIDGRRTSA